MKVFGFFVSKKYEGKNLFIFSCVFSYVFLSFWSLIRELKVFSKVPNTVMINSAIAIIISVIVSITLGMLLRWRPFTNLLVSFTWKTPNDSIWLDMLDVKDGDSVKVYFKNKPYYVVGVTNYLDFDSKDPWWAVSKFAKFDVQTHSLYNNEKEFLHDKNKLYTFRLSDVDHMEIFKKQRE